MIAGLSVNDLSLIAGMALAGVLLGLAYFRAMAHTTRLLGEASGGNASWLVPAGLTLGRFAAMAAALFLMVRYGGAPGLMAGFLGFLVARRFAVRAARRTG